VRIVVIGAGFAGLAAADALAASSADVVVLEARDRVGGRVWSRELPNGAVVEMGAEFILPRYTVMRELAGGFGLPLVDKGMFYGDREPRGGVGVDRGSLATAATVVASALAAGAGDGRSAGAFLAELPIDPGAREAITARLEVSCAATVDAVAAHELAGLAKLSREPCPSIAGGNQRLAFALTERLGPAVHLRSPAQRVRWGDGVTVSADGAEIWADACVISVPVSVLGRISFEPSLPDPVADALRAVQYGHAAKLFVPLAEAPPPSAVLSVPERFWTWTGNGADGRVQPVVSCFAGSAPALEGLGVERGTDGWLRGLERLRPDLALQGEDAVLSTWDDDPWTRGAYSIATPAGPDGEALSGRVGPLVFCGEHTAGEYSALMEGALRSGRRAAADVLAHVDR
jgi:monoamine oxidase